MLFTNSLRRDSELVTATVVRMLRDGSWDTLLSEEGRSQDYEIRAIFRTPAYGGWNRNISHR